MRRSDSTNPAVTGLAGTALLALTALPAAAATVPMTSRGVAQTSRHVQVFARGGSLTGPDDLTAMDGHLFVAYQNGIGPQGQPGPTGALDSVVVEYTRSGHRVHSWSLRGHCDGLTADPAQHRLLASVNEDGNSSLYTIKPEGRRPPVHRYRYSENPLPHGGGTDAISIVGGTILISASAPTVSNGPAVYRVTLAGSTATLRPVFYDNSEARVAAAGGTASGATERLALTDPDSNGLVPAVSPRFAGDFVLDSQGDKQQVYVSRPASRHPVLSLLNLSQSVNDTAWATARHGTLFLTDHQDNEIVAITGTFQPGTAYVAVTPGDANNPGANPAANYLGVLDLHTGLISTVTTAVQPQGLLFVASGDRAN